MNLQPLSLRAYQLSHLNSMLFRELAVSTSVLPIPLLNVERLPVSPAF